MLLIVHKIWHGISQEGYRQVLTKINHNYICQQGNILLDNQRVLDLVRMSRSRVKGQRRGGVCVLRMLLVDFFSYCRYELVGTNAYTVTDSTKHVHRYVVPPAERISVKTGDIIGVLYGPNGFGVPMQRCDRRYYPESDVRKAVNSAVICVLVVKTDNEISVGRLNHSLNSATFRFRKVQYTH